jgi:hypothetical protein
VQVIKATCPFCDRVAYPVRCSCNGVFVGRYGDWTCTNCHHSFNGAKYRCNNCRREYLSSGNTEITQWHS